MTLATVTLVINPKAGTGFIVLRACANEGSRIALCSRRWQSVLRPQMGFRPGTYDLIQSWWMAGTLPISTASSSGFVVRCWITPPHNYQSNVYDDITHEVHCV